MIYVLTLTLLLDVNKQDLIMQPLFEGKDCLIKITLNFLALKHTCERVPILRAPMINPKEFFCMYLGELFIYLYKK